MNPAPPLDKEDLSPRIFRASTLTLELIERHSVSLDYAASNIFRRMRLRPGERRASYQVSWSTLTSFAGADLLLAKHGYTGMPLRRKNAFRVAYALAAKHGLDVDAIASLRGGLLGNKLLSLLSRRGIEKVRETIASMEGFERIAYSYTVPPLIAETLTSLLGLRRAENIASAFAWRRVWVRPFSPLRLEALAVELERKNLRYRRAKDIEYVFEVLVKPWEPLPPLSTGIYQDKASVAAASLLHGAGTPLLDAAAAPLAKTGVLCWEKNVEPVAVDVSYSRLRGGRQLLSNCGLYHLVTADSTLPPLLQKFSGALLDAPCTNSGALGRDPGLRLSLWRLTRERVLEYSELQRRMLNAVATLVKRGGKVVYSTCSVFPEEGEEVVESPGIPLKPLETPLNAECGYRSRCTYKRFFPDKAGTTGFFVAVLERRE